MKAFFFAPFIIIGLCLPKGWAAEESLDLETETKPKVQTHTSSSTFGKFSFMGRVDLTYESANPDPSGDPNGSSHQALKNNHFLVFIKVKASEKTSFMGEIVGQKFFYVDYETGVSWARPKIQFGKIIVPFGDTRRFHHFYGGIQGYSGNGVMFANIWSEPGANVNWKLPLGEVDTYFVNSIAASSETVDPDLATSNENRQAGGMRWTVPIGAKVTGIISGYSGEYWYRKRLQIGGADIYSDYGVFDWSFFRRLRFAAGMANATVEEAPVRGTYESRGDYLEISTNAIGPGEARVRYGTFLKYVGTQTDKDVHNTNLGYLFQVDVMRVLIEHQWNYESQNEKNNDITRAMVSLDF